MTESLRVAGIHRSFICGGEEEGGGGPRPCEEEEEEVEFSKNPKKKFGLIRWKLHLIQSGSSGGVREGRGGEGEGGENITHSRPPSRSSPRRFYERDARARRRPQQHRREPQRTHAAASSRPAPSLSRRSAASPDPAAAFMDLLG